MIQNIFRARKQGGGEMIAAKFLTTMGGDKEGGRLQSMMSGGAGLQSDGSAKGRWGKALLHAAVVADERVAERRKQQALQMTAAPSEERDGTLSMSDYLSMISRNLLLTAIVPIV